MTQIFKFCIVTVTDSLKQILGLFKWLFLTSADCAYSCLQFLASGRRQYPVSQQPQLYAEFNLLECLSLMPYL